MRKVLKWQASPEKLPMVHVEWADATSPRYPWESWDDVLDMTINPCYSVGYLVPHEDKDLIVLAQSVHWDQAGNVIMIPRAWVKKIKRIK